MGRSFLGLLVIMILGCLTVTFSLADSGDLSSGGHRGAGKFALIYNGVGSMEGCPEAVAGVVLAAGLPVKFVSDPRRIPEMLSQACLFAIGGTQDNTGPMRRSFSVDVVKAIQEFLSAGGSYLGICGGAFMASQGWETEAGFVGGFALVPATTDYFIDDPTPMIVPVRWKGQVRKMYYQSGPKFNLVSGRQSVDKVAFYEDGSVAALKCSYGRGKVFVSGPHPEADQSWLLEDGLSLAGWTPTASLAVAIVQDIVP